MNIGITGATGFIGQKLVDLALRRGHEVIAFSRRPEKKIPGCEMRAFTADCPPDFTGCEAVVHLAGESVHGLWTAAKKRRIKESRVLGTRRVVEAMNALPQKPAVFICGSGIGIYREGTDDELTESAPEGANFLADVVKVWEAEALRAVGIRTVLLRTSLVLGRKGGALKVMLPPFRLGLGAQISDGRQWLSWIHIEDHVMLILFALENLDVHGPLNATGPWPVRNAEFTQTLAKVLRRPAWFRAPAWILRIALGDFSREVLDSKRVVPAAATEAGFRFRFPELQPALADLLG